MAGRAAIRWHWLASRLALLQGDPTSAVNELTASRAALPDGATSIDQARWFEQAAALAEAQGNPSAAVGWLQQADANYRLQSLPWLEFESALVSHGLAVR
ncbi:MAG: hypothetical protein KDI37_15000 [Xanthomonadales bacterium]|nr:hypothetical protein [Xanthomonadales bacterium]MCB1627477.1 hypothetical protein [Xanthomonadales bacterium]MCB1633914.1 hypothetical protein [Xanthomonadales bacterium]MCB1643034.1 hypothetical protein [Xanthomonadales bacterium]